MEDTSTPSDISRSMRVLVIDDNPATQERLHRFPHGQETYDTTRDLVESSLIQEASEQHAGGQDGFRVDVANQGQEGVERIRNAASNDHPYALAFVDIHVPPGCDCTQTLVRLWAEDSDLQIVVCSDCSDSIWAEVARHLNQHDNLLILRKPLDNIEVRQLSHALTQKWYLAKRARIKQAELERLVRDQTAEIAEIRDITTFLLARVADSRDPETGDHVHRIRSYCRIIVEQLQQEGPYKSEIDDAFVEDLYRSSPLHDIGKVGIPDAVLLKPDRLTTEEFELMKRHTIIGADALDDSARHARAGGFLTMAAQIARHHHERFDGSGYPDGLKGNSIPLSARIMALADVYDALTTARVYKVAFDTGVARLMIENETGRHFDPAVVKAFLAREHDFLRVLQYSAASHGSQRNWNGPMPTLSVQSSATFPAGTLAGASL